MPGTTPVYGFPYPEPTDLVADYPALGQQLAEDIEDVLPTIGGLTLVSASGFSAVSSVSVNNVFTSATRNYYVMWDLTNGDAVEVLLRLRASGTDATGANYKMQHIRGSGSSAVSVSETITYLPLGFGSAAVRRFGAIKFYAPQIATPTGLIAEHYNNLTTPTAGLSGVFHDLSSAYDGFTIYPQTGTITGTLRVYGLKD